MASSGGFRRTGVAVALCICIAAALAHTAKSAVLVRSTFDSAVTGQDPPAPWLRLEYAGVFTANVPVGSQLQIVADPRRRGRAARFVLHPGDRYGGSSGERSLLSMAPPDGWSASPEHEGADYFYSWSSLFPPDWQPPPHWGIILEFHADNRFLLAPLRINVTGSQISLDMTTGQCATQLVCAYRRSFPLVRAFALDRWHDFVMRVRWTKSNAGNVTVWHRVESGRWSRVVRARAIPTLPSYPGQPDTLIDALFGLYTDAGSTTRVVYGDNFARSTSFADASGVFPPRRQSSAVRSAKSG